MLALFSNSSPPPRFRTSLTGSHEGPEERLRRWHGPIQSELCSSASLLREKLELLLPIYQWKHRGSREDEEKELWGAGGPKSEEKGQTACEQEEEEDGKRGHCKLIRSWNSDLLFISRLSNRSESIKSQCFSIIGKKRASSVEKLRDEPVLTFRASLFGFFWFRRSIIRQHDTVKNILYLY